MNIIIIIILPGSSRPVYSGEWGVAFLAACRNEAVIVTSPGTKIPLQALNQSFSLLCTCSLLPSGGPGWTLVKANHVRDSADDVFPREE